MTGLSRASYEEEVTSTFFKKKKNHTTPYRFYLPFIVQVIKLRLGHIVKHEINSYEITVMNSYEPHGVNLAP